MELERAVHHGVVAVPLARGQVPAISGMQAFIVVQGPGAQVPEAEGGREQHQGCVGCYLPLDRYGLRSNEPLQNRGLRLPLLYVL